MNQSILVILRRLKSDKASVQLIFIPEQVQKVHRVQISADVILSKITIAGPGAIDLQERLEVHWGDIDRAKAPDLCMRLSTH